MVSATHNSSFGRLSALDWAFCLRINRAGHARWVRRLMGAVSRLGDGGFWAGVVLFALLTDGARAVPLALRAVAVAAACYVLYAFPKRKTARPRPYLVSSEILRSAEPLDQYSFPSGHTMQAVALTIMLTAAHPLFAWMLAPFTVLVALSRVVVGLHYPSDVAAGALLGGSVGILALAL